MAQLLIRANVYGDLGALRIARGAVERGNMDLDARWESLDLALSSADGAPPGRVKSRMRFETRFWAAPHAAADGDWGRCDDLLGEAEQALYEWLPEARDVSPFGDSEPSKTKLGLCDVERRVAVHMLEQGDSPDSCAANSLAAEVTWAHEVLIRDPAKPARKQQLRELLDPPLEQLARAGDVKAPTLAWQRRTGNYELPRQRLLGPSFYRNGTVLKAVI